MTRLTYDQEVHLTEAADSAVCYGDLEGAQDVARIHGIPWAMVEAQIPVREAFWAESRAAADAYAAKRAAEAAAPLCPRCKGWGRWTMTTDPYAARNARAETFTCPDCHGTGRAKEGEAK